MPRAQVTAFLPLRTNWFHIMLSLAGREQHGYGIMQEVLDRTGGTVRLWPATLYGSLRRLMDEGLIEAAPERRPLDTEDPRRRYYRLSTLGRQVLAAEIARLEDLVRAARSKRRALGLESPT